MNTSTTHKLNISLKRYIRKTWDGIYDFFNQYNGSLGGIKAKTEPVITDAEIATISDTTAAYGHLNQAIVETKHFLTALRALRVQLLTQKNLDPLHVPNIQYLIDLLADIEGKHGGLLWQEDRLTNRVLRSPHCNREDYDLLGINYKPTHKPDPAQSVGRIYPAFTGGGVTVHWTLPRGLADARVTRSINHDTPVIIYQGSENNCADQHPVPHQAQVWAYTLEPLLHGKLYGKNPSPKKSSSAATSASRKSKFNTELRPRRREGAKDFFLTGRSRRTWSLFFKPSMNSMFSL